MLATAIIAFREFLEAFLLLGIFVGINRTLQLNKHKEILSAGVLGIVLSLLFPILVFFFSSNRQHILTEKNTDILEGYFLIFSGCFLAYVVFSLHQFMKLYRDTTIAKARQKMEQKIFDISLFFTIVFFICREGFEVALLVATTSIFSVFWTNITGLLLGFAGAFLIGFSTFLTYIKLPMKIIFRYTEYAIILIGAAMVKNGISVLLENYLHIHWGKILPLPFQFLPSDTTILGHLLKNLLGVQQEMSLIQLIFMGIYMLVIQYLFFIKKPLVQVPSEEIKTV